MATRRNEFIAEQSAAILADIDKMRGMVASLVAAAQNERSDANRVFATMQLALTVQDAARMVCASTEALETLKSYTE